MNVSAPRLETVEALVENHSLPLLVQQRAGTRLLVHRSCRIPYVICQTLDKSSHSEEEYFLIPLSNKGFYGAVSEHDEPTRSFLSLSHILNSTTKDTVDILVNSVTPIRQLNTESKEVVNKVLLPGETIQVAKNSSCPHLNKSRKQSLCCLRPVVTESPDNTVCIRDKSQHVHLDREAVSRLYHVSQGPIDHMEQGTVYTIQDITQHQSLPKVVCSILTKPTGRDELQLPKIFRMIKIISDRVLLAYRLTESNHPHPDDVVELSSYCQELFAIAESSRVNMDDIREHRVNMSVKRALPGKTLSHTDFHEIVRKSSGLPPKLPERPPTLRLKSNTRSADFSRSLSASHFSEPRRDEDTEVYSVSVRQHSDYDLKQRIHSTPESSTKLNFTGITTPNFVSSSANTVRLPTRDTSNRSILKKFSSMSMRVGKNRRHPSMKTVLDNFHNKRDTENNYSDENFNKPKPKKSLRGLEIVHVLPDAQRSPGVIDLSKAPFGGEKVVSDISTSSSTTVSSSESSDNEDNHIDEFIHNHYHFLDKHHDSSSYQSTPCSDGSTNRGSVPSSTKATVRFSDIVVETHSDASDSREDQSQRNSVIRIIPSPDYDRKSLPANDVTKPINHLDEIRQRFSLSSNGGLKSPTETSLRASTSNMGFKRKSISENDDINSRTSNGNHGNKHTEKRPMATNHVDEIKQRFSLSANGGLKSPTDSSLESNNKPTTNSFVRQQISDISAVSVRTSNRNSGNAQTSNKSTAINHLEEIRQRFNLTPDGGFKQTTGNSRPASRNGVINIRS